MLLKEHVIFNTFFNDVEEGISMRGNKCILQMIP